jgi:hypothetical protein
MRRPVVTGERLFGTVRDGLGGSRVSKRQVRFQISQAEPWESLLLPVA